MKNKEIIFLIEESLDGGFEAKAVGYPIFSEGDSEDEIRKNILDAVRCHFDENEMPSFVNIRFQREEQIAL
ncbi:MAG: 2-oxoisovalerate dehydrogenase [Ignavibacteriota bacterium]